MLYVLNVVESGFIQHVEFLFLKAKPKPKENTI